MTIVSKCHCYHYSIIRTCKSTEITNENVAICEYIRVEVQSKIEFVLYCALMLYRIASLAWLLKLDLIIPQQ